MLTLSPQHSRSALTSSAECAAVVSGDGDDTGGGAKRANHVTSELFSVAAKKLAIEHFRIFYNALDTWLRGGTFEHDTQVVEFHLVNPRWEKRARVALCVQSASSSSTSTKKVYSAVVIRELPSCGTSLYVESRGKTYAPPYGFTEAAYFPFDPTLDEIFTETTNDRTRRVVRATAVQALARHAAEVIFDSCGFAALIGRADDERLVKRSFDAQYFIAKWLRANDRRDSLRASKT